MPCSGLFAEALQAFAEQRAGRLGFVDAAILTVARREGAAVATFDGDFRDQDGIVVVP